MLYCSPYSSLFERAALGFPRTHTHTLNPQIVFIEYDTWLRGDPSEAFTFAAPASIKTAPHARLMNEMFGSYFFVLEPNRQTFYDMLGKVRRCARVYCYCCPQSSDRGGQSPVAAPRHAAGSRAWLASAR